MQGLLVDAIFPGKSLLQEQTSSRLSPLEVNFCPKTECRLPKNIASSRLAASGSPKIKAKRPTALFVSSFYTLSYL